MRTALDDDRADVDADEYGSCSPLLSVTAATGMSIVLHRWPWRTRPPARVGPWPRPKRRYTASRPKGWRLSRYCADSTAELEVLLYPASNGKIEHFWLVLQQDWDLWHAMRSDKAAAITELKPLRPPP